MGSCMTCNKEEPDGPGKIIPDFDGPVSSKKRFPTDIICLIVFVLFLCGSVALGIYAFIVGDPYRLIYSVDSQGRVCGRDPGVENRPFLVFFDISRCLTALSPAEIANFIETQSFDASALFTCPTQQVCVEACPTVTGIGVQRNPVCIDGINTTQFDVLPETVGVSITDPTQVAVATILIDLIAQEKCAPYYIISTSIANRCFPTFVDTNEIANTLFSNLTIGGGPTAMRFDITSAIGNLTINDIFDGTGASVILLTIRQFFSDVLSDLTVAWYGLLVGFFATLIIAFFYILLIRCIAPVMIWGGIAVALLLTAGVAAVCWYQFAIYETGQANSNTTFNLDNLLSADNLRNISGVNFATYALSLIPTNPYIKETWLAAAILVTLVLLVLVLLIIFLAKAIQISIKMIQEASKAVFKLPSTLFYPIVTWVGLVVTLVWFVVVALFLYSGSVRQYALAISDRDAGMEWNLTFPNGSTELRSYTYPCDINDPLFNASTVPVTLVGQNGVNTSTTLSCIFQGFFTDNIFIVLHVYNLFGLLWVCNFWLAFGETVLAGAFAKWYWTFDKKKVPWFALVGAFFRTLIFHVGTIAFGSLIIAIIQLIRAILAYVQKKLKDEPGNPQLKALVHALLCICQCCLWCLEKFLKYINRQIYIMTAIYGYGFCKSACSVVSLLIANIEKVLVKDRVVSFILFMGKVAIVGIVGILAYLGFGDFLHTYGIALFERPLHFSIVPILILMFAAFVIASAFFSVYHMAVDTIFICFLDDLSKNNGIDRPYFMSKSLQRLMGVSNKVKPGTEIHLEEVESSTKS